MKFTRLRLTNIGVFYGNYDFDLNTRINHQNVVLFGGKNGSGKTTILEAIRLALFGCFSYGYRTETPSYFEKVEPMLNSRAKKRGEKLFQIFLDIESVENLERREYTLKRSWILNKNNIKEKLSVTRNGEPLSEKEIDIFQTKLRQETPPQLLEFCLFDGERLSQVLSNDTFSLYLKETAKVMFNLDLFEGLDSDLTTMIKQDSIYGSLTDEQRKLLELEETYSKFKKQHDEIIRQEEAIITAIEEKKATLDDLNRQFELHGGLAKDLRNELVSQMNQIEQKRRVMMEKNKEIISSLFPFVLIKDLVLEVTEQMEKESIYDLREKVSKRVSPNKIEHILESFVASEVLKTEADLSRISKNLFNELIKLLPGDSSKKIHAASNQQFAEVEFLYKQICEIQPEKIVKTFKDNALMIKQVQEIRRQIDENDNTSDLRELLDNIYGIKNELSSLELRKEQIDVNRGQLEEHVSALKQQIDVLKQKVIKARKAENVFEITKRVLEVSRAFQVMQMKKKLQQVEIQTARMLQKLFRKELFVVRVSIDPETFQLKLFDSSNDEINKNILSAGEKQILLLSTIWAIASCSKRRLPFVFDTLFGRLDQTHKRGIIKHLIPRCGDQVIILSTDSEIDEEHYKEISRSLAKTYTIDYDSKESTVKVTEQYFNFTSEEVVDVEFSS